MRAITKRKMPNRAYKLIAFTLAEILITLGIIGIITAMIMPNIISMYQKRVVEAKLKEDVAIISQVVKRADSDIGLTGNIPSNLSGTSEWFDKFFKPYMKYSKICYGTDGCWHNKDYTKNLAGQTAYASYIGHIGVSTVNVKLNNGTNLNIDWQMPSTMEKYMGIETEETGIAIFIDANGDSLPNVIGKDIYLLIFTSEGMHFAGENQPEEVIDENCGQNANPTNGGYFCITKVKNNNWKIPNEVWNKQ